MRISENGLEQIKRREGCRLTAYPDASGCSIGWGHFGVQPGTVWTQQQADDQLVKDILPIEDAINQAVKAPLEQDQFDALVSFAYNVGPHAFLSSTLLKRLNSGKFDDVPNQMMRWVFSGGVESPALEARRKDEIAQFEGKET